MTDLGQHKEKEQEGADRAPKGRALLFLGSCV
jgi:hypothetical protein